MARNRITIQNNIPEKSKRFVRIMNNQIQIGLRDAGNKILANSQKRFSSHFSGGKTGKVLSAIAASGISVKQTGDTRTTLFVADMDILDAKTALPPTKAEGNLYHLWRLLHAGWGRKGNNANSAIFNKDKRTSDYIAQIIVQTSALEPIFFPGRHAPFFELLNVIGLPGINVIRHPGFKGHEWFLNNLDLFDEDFSFIVKRINQAMQRAETLSLG